MRLSYLLVALPLFGCATSPPPQRPIASSEEASSENLGWQDYLHTLDGIPLQTDCQPRRFDPPAGVPVTGKVILVHGYTACPQQFFDFAKILAERGQVVYLPLLPGHGRVAPDPKHDNYQELPGENDWTRYADLAEQINALARADDLPTGIGGLSVGSVVALRAVLDEPSLYRRAVFFTPFFKAANAKKFGLPFKLPLGSAVVPALGRFGPTKKLLGGWGPHCRVEIAKGRKGICTFRFDQLLATQTFGLQILKELHSLPLSVQFVGVEDDPAADNASIVSAIATLRSSGTPAHACFYAKGANHSLFSRFDAPDQHKFWLDSLLAASTAFLTEGDYFPASTPSNVRGYPRCNAD